MYSQQHGISSFFGSDKKDFLDSWANQKDINEQIKDPKKLRTEPMEIAEPTVSEKKTGLKIVTQKIGGGGASISKEQVAKAKQRDSMIKLRKERKASGLSASGKSKVKTLPDELQILIKDFAVAKYTLKEKEKLRLLYRRISKDYEIILYSRRLLKNPKTNKIHGSEVNQEDYNRFKSRESDYYNMMKEISDALGWDEKERDSNKYVYDELMDYSARQYGLKKDKQGYKYNMVDAAWKLVDDLRRIEKYRDELNIIFKK
jgi:hypothetical protein